MQEIKIRWMNNRDLPAVLEIEGLCFSTPWTEKTFAHAKKQQNTTVAVAERGGNVVGFMVYELHAKDINLMNLAVMPAHQGTGVGRAMVAKLKDKLCRERRSRIRLICRETNLEAHLFFAKMGFKALRVIVGAYEESDDAAYEFEFNIDPDN